MFYLLLNPSNFNFLFFFCKPYFGLWYFLSIVTVWRSTVLLLVLTFCLLFNSFHNRYIYLFSIIGIMSLSVIFRQIFLFVGLSFHSSSHNHQESITFCLRFILYNDLKSLLVSLRVILMCTHTWTYNLIIIGDTGLHSFTYKNMW